jgi:nitrate/nitrite transport system substrate-binding protein
MKAMAAEQGAAGEEGPEDRLPADHLRHADHHGRSDGLLRQAGLNVSLIKTAGWAVVRDKVINKEYDASHMLSPMPLAISMGLGSQAMPTDVIPAIENINGQAITLHMKHKDKRDPKQWKGMKFAMPFDYSMHNLLLRYYLAEHGVDPDKDVQLRVMPPPDMVANLRAGGIDGFSGRSRSTSARCSTASASSTPCPARSGTASLLRLRCYRKFKQGNPNTFAALFRAIAWPRICPQGGKPQGDHQGHRGPATI